MSDLFSKQKELPKIDKVITLKFTKDDKAKVELASHKNDVTVSEFIRTVVLDYISKAS